MTVTKVRAMMLRVTRMLSVWTIRVAVWYGSSSQVSTYTNNTDTDNIELPTFSEENEDRNKDQEKSDSPNKENFTSFFLRN